MSEPNGVLDVPNYCAEAKDSQSVPETPAITMHKKGGSWRPTCRGDERPGAGFVEVRAVGAPRTDRPTRFVLNPTIFKKCIIFLQKIKFYVYHCTFIYIYYLITLFVKFNELYGRVMISGVQRVCNLRVGSRKNSE